MSVAGVSRAGRPNGSHLDRRRRQYARAHPTSTIRRRRSWWRALLESITDRMAAWRAKAPEQNNHSAPLRPVYGRGGRARKLEGR